MSTDVKNLEPRPLWNYFADLNEVPRPSKKEQRVIQFAKAFGEKLGLETLVDEIGNVLVRKPASPGMEHRMPIVMQAHLDMVCQKNAETDFDFDSQGIQMFVDGDWVRARGTTLGADNGMGVASIMTILASNDIVHPPLEGLFTIDEETGMTGAQHLKPGWLRGQIMLNLDTEEDTELTIGCAGGCDVTATREYSADPVPNDYEAFQISVRGLQGGHSGMDIHLGRGNANKLMNRILWGIARDHAARIGSINGGGLRNAIPRESFAVVVVPTAHAPGMRDWLQSTAATIRQEYATTDPNLEISFESTDMPAGLLPLDLQKTVLGSIYACPHGIHRMSPEIRDLVQTSNNLARVLVADGHISIMCLTRSSVNSERDDLAHAIVAGLELTGASVTVMGGYPGWQPDPDSSIVQLMSSLYEEMFGESAHVAACHAGLECGIVGQHYPQMEMISFGPTIKGAHSPDERVQISSVQKYWRFLLESLKRIPSAA